MTNPLLLIGQLITLLMAAGLLGTLYTALRRAMKRLRQPSLQQRKASGFAVAALLIWMLISGVLAELPVFGGAGRAMLLFLPPALISATLLGFRFFRALLIAIPPNWLVKVQGVRIVLNLLLWMGYEGRYVPPQLTFLWFNYDIVVGVSALMGSFAFFAGNRMRRPEALLWNVFGLFSLLYLVLIGLISLPDANWQLFKTVPDSSFLLQTAFVPLLSFVLPFCFAMHLYSIWQMLRLPSRRRFVLRR